MYDIMTIRCKIMTIKIHVDILAGKKDMSPQSRAKINTQVCNNLRGTS